MKLKYIILLITLFTPPTYAVNFFSNWDTQATVAIQRANKEGVDLVKKSALICVGTAGSIISLLMLKNCIECYKQEKDSHTKTAVKLGTAITLLVSSIATIL